MKTPGKTKLMALGVSGMLAVGVLGAGAAMAQEGATPTPTEQAAGHRQHHPVRNILGAVVEASGLDKSVFLQGLKDGKSINQVLSENALDPAAVQADALAIVDAKLDEAVAAGRLTQEQADAAYARISEKLPELMDQAPSGEHRPHPLFNLLRGFTQTAADSIGITVEELVSALRGGDTVADVAAANGVDPQAVVDDLVAASEAKIDQLVSEGKITAEQGEKAKERAASAAEKFVNEGRPERPAGEGRPGIRGGR